MGDLSRKTGIIKNNGTQIQIKNAFYLTWNNNITTNSLVVPEIIGQQSTALAISIAFGSRANRHNPQHEFAFSGRYNSELNVPITALPTECINYHNVMMYLAMK